MSDRLFHRLVVRTNHIEWDASPEYTASTLHLRFLTRVEGELIRPSEQVRLADDHYAIVGGGGGRTEMEGRFIEVVCSGESPEHAEACTHALLGFVGLCVGEAAIGEIVFSEAHSSRPDSDGASVTVRSMHRIPLPLKGNSVDALEAGLERAARAADGREAVAIALRWYEHGIRATVALDRVLSFFIGIEAIIKAHARKRLRSRLAPLAENQQFLDLLAQYADSTDPKSVKTLASSLVVEPRNVERFEFYAKEQGLDPTTIETFQRLGRLRNPAVHGEFTSASEDDAEDARTLIRKLLKSELGLTMELFEDRVPFQHSTVISRSSNQPGVGTPSIDWVKRLGMTTGGRDAGDGNDEA